MSNKGIVIGIVASLIIAIGAGLAFQTNVIVNIPSNGSTPTNSVPTSNVNKSPESVEPTTNEPTTLETTTHEPTSSTELIPYGPTKYLSFKDSPFYEFSKSSKYFYLENFENGGLTTPGVSVKNADIRNPSKDTDSVDIDDGLADGFGNDGTSLYSGTKNAIIFTFDESQLGQLPNYVGIVATDQRWESQKIFFEAYDEDGYKIYTSQAANVEGNTKTDNDRFFGVFYNKGVKGMKIESTYSWDNIEVDHLQYGRTK